MRRKVWVPAEVLCSAMSTGDSLRGDTASLGTLGAMRLGGATSSYGTVARDAGIPAMCRKVGTMQNCPTQTLRVMRGLGLRPPVVIAFLSPK